MQLQTQTIARNTKPNVVVLSSDIKGTEVVEWQPAGDPNGGDFQVVSENILGLASFTKLLARGIIVLDQADEATKAAMDLQTAAFEKRLNGAAQAAKDVIDPEAKNDFLQLPCIGPDTRGVGVCGVEVPVREKTKDEHPVLCSTHANLASQYVSSEEQVGTSIVKKWTRVTMTPREQQQV